MKLSALMFVLTLAANLPAAQNLAVVVNTDTAISLDTLGTAERVASRILATADVRISWHPNMNHAKSARARIIVLTLETKEQPSPDRREHALGYAFPFEGVHAAVFYGRIGRICVPSQEPFVLGHVMAHEITHLLQGIEHHSERGVMKASWDWRDISDMRSDVLPFTAEDIRMIHEVSGRSDVSRLLLPLP